MSNVGCLIATAVTARQVDDHRSTCSVIYAQWSRESLVWQCKDATFEVTWWACKDQLVSCMPDQEEKLRAKQAKLAAQATGGAGTPTAGVNSDASSARSSAYPLVCLNTLHVSRKCPPSSAQCTKALFAPLWPMLKRLTQSTRLHLTHKSDTTIGPAAAAAVPARPAVARTQAGAAAVEKIPGESPMDYAKRVCPVRLPGFDGESVRNRKICVSRETLKESAATSCGHSVGVACVQTSNQGTNHGPCTPQVMAAKAQSRGSAGTRAPSKAPPATQSPSTTGARSGY